MKLDRRGGQFLLVDILHWVIAIAASFAIAGICVVLYQQVGTKPSVSAKPGEVIPVQVAAPAERTENGVIPTDAWAEAFPEIVASYKANSTNTYRVSYLSEDQDPYLKDIYEGFGFAKDYTSAIGHEYCLEDVANTERPHALANCLTCKTADFTALVNKMGEQAYSLSFDEVFPSMTENVGCYNCHENQAGDAGKLVVTHDYIIDRLGDEMQNINAATLSCGQCHIEYYFKTDTKACTVPYTTVAEMDPEAILAYYNEMNFADWTQESTGARLLKAQHPEMETYLGTGSVHAGMGLSCADCHMEKKTENGKTYSSHELVSPLNSATLLETCARCHKDTDMTAKVRSLQAEITDREKQVGNALAELKNKLAEANASGKYTEEELNVIRDYYRSAVWFFDYDYVENSEGAHNSKLANRCLDLAEANIAEANKLFK